MAYKRVVEKFKGSGDVSNPKPIESKVPTNDVEAIEAYFTNNLRPTLEML